VVQQQQADAQAQQGAPHPFDQVLAQMPKHEQDQFRKLPPEQQNAIMQQFEQGAPQ
jgi:hypothetical protein